MSFSFHLNLNADLLRTFVQRGERIATIVTIQMLTNNAKEVQATIMTMMTMAMMMINLNKDLLRTFVQPTAWRKNYNYYDDDYDGDDDDYLNKDLLRTFVQPTAWRKNRDYVLYYHNWSWTVVTGGDDDVFDDLII